MYEGHKRIGIGLAGIGRMGRQYVQAVQQLEGAFLSAIYSPVKVDGSIQYVNIYNEFQDMLKDPHIDAVVIATPSHTHAQMAMQAAQRGKHVLIEKPMALSLREGNLIVDICRQFKVVLMVSFIERFNPVFIEARNILLGERLGEVRSFNCKRRTKSTHRPLWYWDERKSGGIFIDLLGHDVDLLRWFLQDDVQSVAAIHQRGEKKARVPYEFGYVLLRFRNGIIGSVESNWNLPDAFPAWGDIALEILGSEGMVHVDTGANQPITFCSPKSSTSFIHDESSDRWSAVDLGRKDAIRSMLDNFVASIMGEKPVGVTGEDGVRALEVTCAAVESAETGKIVYLS